MYGFDRAVLEAVSALESVLLPYDKGCALVDCVFGADCLTGAAADAVLADLVALGLPRGVPHGEVAEQDGMDSEVEILNRGVLDDVDDSYRPGVARIDIDEVGLLLEYLVLPFFLFLGLLDFPRQAYHLLESRHPFHLDIAAVLQLMGKALAPRRIEIDNVRAEMYCAHAPHLRTVVLVHGRYVQYAYPLQFLQAQFLGYLDFFHNLASADFFPALRVWGVHRAVAAVIDDVVIGVVLGIEKPLLVFEQGPEMVLEAEICVRIPVLLKLGYRKVTFDGTRIRMDWQSVRREALRRLLRQLGVKDKAADREEEAERAHDVVPRIGLD